MNNQESSIAASPYNNALTMESFFENQALAAPERTAIRYLNKPYSYGSLKKMVDGLADYLQNVLGIIPHEIVGIAAERSIEMMVGLFAIMSIGAVYLPLSSSYPEERMRYILQDSKMRVLLTEESPHFDGLPVDIVRVSEIIKKDREGNYTKTHHALDPVYVLYTSGTTGKPKGIVVEHQSVINRLCWMQKEYGITEKDIILQKTPVIFDVSVWELFWWTLSGAQMCLLPRGMEKFPQAIVDCIEKEKITIIHFVPSMLYSFLCYIAGSDNVDRLSSLSYVFTSGEVLNQTCARMFYEILNRRIGTKLVNLYGPTEATVDVTYYNCPNELPEQIPIGKPIDHTELYILDHETVLPEGQAGEIGISGICLARGYLNQPELTARKFMQNPLDNQERLYITGDIGVVKDDGNIYFLGRSDYQVKIRGFRIELEEIESIILKYPNINQCVVVDYPKGLDTFLIAFVSSDTKIDIKKLKTYLASQLPQYMVPNRYYILEDFPRLPSGKLDRSTLRKQYLDKK